MAPRSGNRVAPIRFQRLWSTVLFLLSFALLLELLRRRQDWAPVTNFRTFDGLALNDREPFVHHYRPRDAFYPSTLWVGLPHLKALAADERLLQGAPQEALHLYREAMDLEPRDLYSRFATACLLAEEQQIAEALELAEEMAARYSQVRSVRLLHELLVRRAARHHAPLELLYLEALGAVAHMVDLASLPDIDPLQDLVEARLLGKRPAPKARAMGSTGSLCLELLDPDRGPDRARSLLRQDGSVEMYLLALATLAPLHDPQDAPLLDQAVQALRSLEPDNAYFDFLQAALQCPPPILLWAGEDEPPPAPPPIGDAMAEALLSALAKERVHTHAAELHSLLVSSGRDAGDTFAELHVPSPADLLFLGEPLFPHRLATLALDSRRDFDDQAGAALLLGALTLLRFHNDLLPDPFAFMEIPQYYGALFLELDLPAGLRQDVESCVARLPQPPAVPPRVRLFQRYVLRPLPIPALVQAMDRRYAVDPAALAHDLRRALERG